MTDLSPLGWATDRVSEVPAGAAVARVARVDRGLLTVLTATGARTLTDLNGDKLKSAAAMLKTYSDLDRQTRQALSDSLRVLVHAYARNVASDVQKNELDPLRRWLDGERRSGRK